MHANEVGNSGDVGFYVAPGTIAVSVGAPVVYAPPPPTTVVYAGQPPAFASLPRAAGEWQLFPRDDAAVRRRASPG